jgi:dehydrogenase/reductase SDR family protein 12
MIRLSLTEDTVRANQGHRGEIMSWFSQMKDSILDTSIAFSFDRSGYIRHQKLFEPKDLELDCQGKRYLITGANSGLGKATATAIAHRNGIVHLLCRNKERAQQAQHEIKEKTGNEEIYIDIIDMSDLTSIRDAASSLMSAPIHGLIHNAGILPLQRSQSPQGFESTFATNVLGPQLLTTLLQTTLEQTSGARIIWVSSGGMYPAKLSLKQLKEPKEPFDGVQAYAQTKRAQVILNRLWAHKSSVWTQCMHPGWADTVGVQNSLPKFQKMMKGRLRSSEEGADTILWLAIATSVYSESSGLFWFDRRAVREHFLPWTQISTEKEQNLWSTLEELISYYYL